ncbi:MAG: tRNA 2-thiocytidine biosynthesis TtcA family protein, partial [Enterocloster sp.]
FHKELFSRFARAVREYELIQENDRIAVCISGGKDSMLMAKLFQELKRHNKLSFELVFLVMDPGYSRINRQVIENNARMLNIPVTIFESDIFEAVYNVQKSPCYLCARMRRGYLYSKAKELGCNKIALGHHYDDVIETILMGMLYGGYAHSLQGRRKTSLFSGAVCRYGRGRKYRLSCRQTQQTAQPAEEIRSHSRRPLLPGAAGRQE